MSLDFLMAHPGPIRELFLRSEYDTPEQIRPEIPNFEKSAKTLRLRLMSSEGNLWTLEFTDLEREIMPATGNFEKYYFNIRPIFNGRLWDVISAQPIRPTFERTIDRFVAFSSNLEHAFIPPKFIEQVAAEHEIVDQVMAFTASRDYFTVHVSPNPGPYISGVDSSELRLKSSNASHDYEILVKTNRPIGPLVLSDMDLRLKRGKDECRLRINSHGYLSQVGRGERELYSDVRNRLMKFFEEQDGWVKFLPTSEKEEFRDIEHELSFKSTKVHFGRAFQLRFSFALDENSLLKLKGLFTSNFHASQFIGTVETEIPEKSFRIRSSDLNGGGDAIVAAQVGSAIAYITPLVNTRIRTLERIYKTILNKFDVDADLVGPRS